MTLRFGAFSTFVAFVFLATNSAFPQSVLVARQMEVWKIDANGPIARLKFDFGGPSLQASVHGTTGPTVSPDQKNIAYVRGNDLWVLDVAGMNSSRVSNVGRTGTAQFASVFVMITAWSRDSQKILYYLESGETEDPDGTAPERKLRDVPYGAYIYDIAARKSLPTFVPGEFLAWLPGENFLLKTDELENSRLIRVHCGEKNEEPLPVGPGDYSQAEVSLDGKRIAVLRGSEIVLIDLDSGQMSSVAKGAWAEYQWPAFSPSGSHLSYVKQYPLSTPGGYGNELIVDGQPIYRSDRDFSSYWINDETLALLLYDRSPAKHTTWILIDRKTGTEKAPHSAR
jgi:Tol biopolymer transport system component